MTSFNQWNINDFYKHSVGINRIIYDLQPARSPRNQNTAQISKITPVIIKKWIFDFKESEGVATFINDTIDSKNILIISDLKTITILVKFQKPLCTCNIYIPDIKIFTKQHLKDVIKQFPKPFILLGDFNSHNTSWGSTYNYYNRAPMVKELLEVETLVLLNNNEPTRHNVLNGNFSTITLTITNINSTQAYI
jgi:hypothetical protein